MEGIEKLSCPTIHFRTTQSLEEMGALSLIPRGGSTSGNIAGSTIWSSWGRAMGVCGPSFCEGKRMHRPLLRGYPTPTF